MVNKEQETTEIKSLREGLGQEFDKENSTLREALKDHPDLYEAQREAYVKAKLLEQENGELKERVGELQSFAEKRTEQLIQRSADSVTGLRRREIMYETLEKEVDSLFDKELETLSEQELLKFLESLDLKKIEDIKLSVLMSDVSFLSLVNDKGGHEQGDRFMRTMGDVARLVGSPKITPPEEEPMDAKFVASRHGGDEISAIVREAKRGAEEVAAEMRVKVGESREAREILEPHRLEPNLDVGVAHISEGVEAFKRFLSEMIKRQMEIPKGERKRKLIDLMVGIADRRAALQKGETRINYLIKLKNEDPAHYEEVINWLRKGAFGATDREIDQLVAEKEKMDELEWKHRLLKFLREKEQVVYEKELAGKAIERAIIQSIAG